MRRLFIAGLLGLLCLAAGDTPEDGWEPVKKEIVDTANWQRVVLTTDKIFVYMGRGETPAGRAARLGVAWGEFEAKVAALIEKKWDGTLVDMSADALLTEVLDAVSAFDAALGGRFKYFHQLMEYYGNLQDTASKANGILSLMISAYEILSVDPQDPIAVAGALQMYLELAAELTGKVFPPAGIYLQIMSTGVKNILPHLKIMRDRVALTNEAVDTWMQETQEFAVDFQEFTGSEPADSELESIANAEPDGPPSCEVKEANDIDVIDKKVEEYAARRTETYHKVAELNLNGTQLRVAINALQLRVDDLQSQVDGGATELEGDLADAIQRLGEKQAAYEQVTRWLAVGYEESIQDHYYYLRATLRWIKQVQVWRNNEACEQPWLGWYENAVKRALAKTPFMPPK